MRYMHGEALEVLPRVLDAADVRRAVLVGHSDGGSIAAIHAVDTKAVGLDDLGRPQGRHLFGLYELLLRCLQILVGGAQVQNRRSAR